MAFTGRCNDDALTPFIKTDTVNKNRECLLGRKRKPPRLWFREKRGMWFIVDHGRHIGTGCPKDNRIDAENELLKYIEGRSEIKRSFVYFITTDKDDFPIKIGISETHRVRFNSIQVALPYELKVLAILPTDDPMLERRLHRKFSHLRLRGEWFERSPEITDYIDHLVTNTMAA